MCPPEIRNVHGKHNSFVIAKREYFLQTEKTRFKIEKQHHAAFHQGLHCLLW